MDLLAAVAGLALLGPVMLLVAFLVRLDSPGPVFYRGRRVGKGGRLFHIIKFRSMVAGADKCGPGVTGAGDCRVTGVGRWLRLAKLDELPQLFNVLKGEMSLVGPRPEAPEYVRFYTEGEREVLKVRPGITGPAQVDFRHEEEMLSGPDREEVYVRDILPRKLAIDLEYIKKRSDLGDILLILKTFRAMFRVGRKPAPGAGKGAEDLWKFGG